MAVTPDDIAVALGRPAPEQSSHAWQQWAMWIADATMLIANRPAGRGGPLNLAALDTDVLDYVVREAVVAVVRRPDDAVQVDVQVDDGRVSKRYQTSTGRVSILDVWWTLLDPPQADTDSFSVQPGFVPDYAIVVVE